MGHYEPKPSYGLLVVACPPDDDPNTDSRFWTAASWDRLLALARRAWRRIRTLSGAAHLARRH